MKCEIEEFPDGTLCLSLGDEGMETDLVFASGAYCKDDPVLKKQRALLEKVVKAFKIYKKRGTVR